MMWYISSICLGVSPTFLAMAPSITPSMVPRAPEILGALGGVVGSFLKKSVNLDKEAIAKADAAWPFAFDASQAFRLSEGVLELSLSLTNQSASPAPAGRGRAGGRRLGSRRGSVRPGRHH